MRGRILPLSIGAICLFTGTTSQRFVKVTVAVAVFNGAMHIPGCIDCLSKQVYRDFEVVFVVDSKTTDDSVALIEEGSSRLPSVRIVIQTDGDRLSGARNIGIREAGGELIWFLDVDDHPYPDFLSELVRIQSETGADMVFCNHLQVTDRAVPPEPEGEFRIDVVSADEALADFTRFPVYSWSRIQRVSIFESGMAMFRNHPAAEDVEQTIRSLAMSERVCYYGKPLYVYYKVGNSATSANRTKEAASMEDTAREALGFVKEVRPQSYSGFRVRMLERLMRQMAFVPYGEYKRVYEGSIAHEVIGELDEPTTEMGVFSKSKALYYLILFPFTHWIWDRRTGPWGPEH